MAFKKNGLSSKREQPPNKGPGRSSEKATAVNQFSEKEADVVVVFAEIIWIKKAITFTANNTPVTTHSTHDLI